VDIVRGLNMAKVEALRAARDHEGLEIYIMQKLTGK
jgi:hypothetical protein